MTSDRRYKQLGIPAFGTYPCCMSNPQALIPGDFLVFQIESGFAMLRVLDIEENGPDPVWHVSAYEDLFFEVDEAAEKAASPGDLRLSIPHVALTNRAFESTQVSRVDHRDLSETDLSAYRKWRQSEEKKISDRSIRLLMGLR